MGQEAQTALTLALSTANSYLETSNLVLEVVVENSSSDAQKALTAIQALHAKGVRTVIGPMTSDEAGAIVGFADANDMMLVSPSSTATALALPDHLFRLVPNDANQAEALTELMKRREITRVLPVHLNDVYGISFEQGFRAQATLPDPGIEVLSAIHYDTTVTDFAPLVQTLTTAVADIDPTHTAILLVGRDSDAVGIFTSAGIDSRLADFKWFSTDAIIREASLVTDATAAAFASKVKLEGFTFACEATAPVMSTMLIAGLMSTEDNPAPSPATLPIWDAVWFVAEALRLNPEADTTALMEGFTSLVNRGANFLGQVTELDANGDLVAVRYSRFTLETMDGVPQWTLVGGFIKSINIGNVNVDVTAAFTKDIGTVVIGAVLPITGTNAEDGVGARYALNLALEHANRYYTTVEGLGIRFTLDIRDSQSNPATTLAQVKALHDQGVNLIIGPENSGELAAILPYVKENGMVVLSTTSTATSLALPGDHVARLTANDSHQARAMSRLMTAQGKQHVLLIHRNDGYGQDFTAAFKKEFAGSVDVYSYETTETKFASVLQQAETRMSETGTTAIDAILVVGLKEVTTLLEQARSGPLTTVDWYGTDGICKSRELLLSTAAQTFAEQTHLTCSAFDVAGLNYFYPAYHVIQDALSPQLGGPMAWNELSTYDALWLGANTFAMSELNADTDTLWTSLQNKPTGAVGIGGSYIFDDNGDRKLSSYAFFAVRGTTDGPAWVLTASYLDYFGAKDELTILDE